MGMGMSNPLLPLRRCLTGGGRQGPLRTHEAIGTATANTQLVNKRTTPTPRPEVHSLGSRSSKQDSACSIGPFLGEAGARR